MEGDLGNNLSPAELRELRAEEISEVSGGIGPVGLALGALTGAAAGLAGGGGWGAAARGALFGAVTGLTGGLALATTGFVRVSWGIRTLGLSAAGGGMGKKIPANAR